MFKKSAVMRSYLDLANNAYIADANFHYHTGQYKRTGGCHNELVVAFYSTGGGV